MDVYIKTIYTNKCPLNIFGKKNLVIPRVNILFILEDYKYDVYIYYKYILIIKIKQDII